MNGLAVVVMLAGTLPATAYPTSEQVTARVASMRLIAPCLVQRDRKDAVRYALADTPAETDAAWSRIRGYTARCIGHFSMQVQPLELRGALAETLLKERGGNLLGRAASLPPVTPIRVAAVTSPHYPVNVVGCAAAAAPARAVDLLMAEPGTTEDGRRAAAFRPSLVGCSPSPDAVDLPDGVVRLLAATALYQRVTAGGAR